RCRGAIRSVATTIGREPRAATTRAGAGAPAGLAGLRAEARHRRRTPCGAQRTRSSESAASDETATDARAPGSFGLPRVVEHPVAVLGRPPTEPFAMPDVGVGDVIGPHRERTRDEARLGPQDPVVGLDRVAAVVKLEDVAALVADVAGAVRLGRTGPVEVEHVASVVPLPILQDRADAAVGEPVEGVDADVGAEAIPQLEVIERDLRRSRLVHERVDRHPPDDCAALGHYVEPDRIPWSRGDAKDHDGHDFAVAALLVVEKFLAD